jgi:hypothetical protein
MKRGVEAMRKYIIHIAMVCLTAGRATACSEPEMASETADLCQSTVKPLSPAQLDSLQTEIEEEREQREYMDTIRREVQVAALAMKLGAPLQYDNVCAAGAQENMGMRLRQRVREIALAMKLDAFDHWAAAPDQVQDSTGQLSGRLNEVSIQGIEDAMALATWQYIVNNAQERTGGLDAGRTIERILYLYLMCGHV